jgi:hypothetical protein
VDRPERLTGQRHLGLGHGPGDPEVGHLHPAVAADQDVPGLYVAVDDPPRVSRLESARGVGDDPGGLARREGARAPDDRGEILTLDDLHHDEWPGDVLAVVVDRDDVGVVERGRALGLLAEARPELGVAAVLRPEELDGDVAIELGVVGPIDRRHAALSEQLDEPVSTAENRPDLRHAGPPSCLPRPARAGRRRRIVPRVDGFAGLSFGPRWLGTGQTSGWCQGSWLPMDRPGNL